MIQPKPPTQESIDQDIAKIERDRASSRALVFTGIVAFAVAFVAVSYLMVTDTTPRDEAGAPTPITGEEIAPIVND